MWGDVGEWLVFADVVVAVVECGAIIVGIALHIYTIWAYNTISLYISSL